MSRNLTIEDMVEVKELRHFRVDLSQDLGHKKGMC